MQVKEHDLVRLKDGREGTILYFYDEGRSVMLEIADENGKTQEQPFVLTSDIEKVLFSA